MKSSFRRASEDSSRIVASFYALRKGNLDYAQVQHVARSVLTCASHNIMVHSLLQRFLRKAVSS